MTIIGAGPAGSLAGALLRAEGLSVLCLEAATFPRYQIGESLLPRSNDLLEEAGLLQAVVARRYQPKNGALFLRGEERERICFAEVFPGQRTSTFQVPRGDFDQTLATRARQLGVDLRFNTKVDSIEFSESGSLISATDVETQEPLSATSRFVIDCSGYGRVLPKLLGLERPSTLGSRAAYFTMVEGDLRDSGDREGDIWICTHPQGAWEWVIPFSDGRTSVGIVGEHSLFSSVEGSDRNKLFTLLQRDPNVERRLRNARPVLRTMKLQSWSSAVTRFWGPGWIVTGNAGEFLDPIFSSGVTLAFESASLGAKWVGRSLKGEPVDWEKSYASVIQKGVDVFKAFVHSWYRNELPQVIFAKTKSQTIRQAITAILGGYVLDPTNPFVRNAEGTLSALFKMAGTPAAGRES